MSIKSIDLIEPTLEVGLSPGSSLNDVLPRLNSANHLVTVAYAGAYCSYSALQQDQFASKRHASFHEKRSRGAFVVTANTLIGNHQASLLDRQVQVNTIRYDTLYLRAPQS